MDARYIAALASLSALAVFMAVALDPVVVYILLSLAVGALHPDWRPLINVVCFAGVFMVSGAHDPFVGDVASFLRALGKGADFALTVLIHFAGLLVTVPVILKVISLRFKEAIGAFSVALWTLVILSAKYIAESQMMGGSVLNVISDVVQGIVENSRFVFSGGRE